MNLLESFKTFLRINRSASDNTVESYLRDLQNFCKFLKKDLNDIKSLKTINNKDVREWLISRRNLVSNRTISRQIVAIKMFFVFLNETYNVRNEVILNMNGLKDNSGIPKAIGYEQIKEIIDSFEKVLNYKNNWEIARDKLLLVLLFSSGMRISEALALKHNDFLKQEFIIFGKGKKERIVPIIDIVIEYYNEYKKKLLDNNIKISANDFVFLNSKKKQLTAREAERFFQKIKINKNLQYFSPHIMRHSFASSLLENGANINQIQELLGHSNLATTQKYTKITQKTINDKLKKINW